MEGKPIETERKPIETELRHGLCYGPMLWPIHRLQEVGPVNLYSLIYVGLVLMGARLSPWGELVILSWPGKMAGIASQKLSFGTLISPHSLLSV